MGRKIPLLVDEDVYYVLQELKASQANDVSSVIRLLFYGAADVVHLNHAQLEQELKQRLLIEEMRAEAMQARQHNTAA